jgi:hypothetical protein
MIFFFQFFFFRVKYSLNVFALLCCLFIVMVENADDDPIETKPNFVDYSVEIKPPKVEASVDVKQIQMKLSFMLKLSSMFVIP